MADIVTFGETMLRLSPPTGERLERARSLAVHPGGAESNVATAMSHLGDDATWVSKLPNSPLGRRISTELQSHGVNPSVIWDDTATARVGTYYVEFGADPRETSVYYDRTNASITTATTTEIPDSVVTESEIFYTSGITPALSSTVAHTTEQLLTTAYANNTTTAFDLNYRSKLWDPQTAGEMYHSLLPVIDILVAAERDVRSCLGYEGDPRVLIDSLTSDYDFETIVLTRGTDGSIGYESDTIIEQPVFEAETVDPIGSGDAFVGGLLSQKLEDESLKNCLEHGAAMASLKRTLEGDAATVTPAEVDAVRASQSGGISR
ncbi:MAG: sugar kinase, ribokinase family [Haloquadratum sp. J07HQX50]|jgi:2-keto-3-deoxygluconate kinase (EC 2.7.1.45)|nr:MAG: sugar kinase, ribokinase family [Haloquadratum sp. J07HQX50]